MHQLPKGLLCYVHFCSFFFNYENMKKYVQLLLSTEMNRKKTEVNRKKRHNRKRYKFWSLAKQRKKSVIFLQLMQVAPFLIKNRGYCFQKRLKAKIRTFHQFCNDLGHFAVICCAKITQNCYNQCKLIVAILCDFHQENQYGRY